MATHRHCRRCRDFYDIKLNACPGCGLHKNDFSKHLRTAILNNHLFGLADNAERENNLMAEMQRGREPDPPRWARQKARKIVADW